MVCLLKQASEEIARGGCSGFLADTVTKIGGALRIAGVAEESLDSASGGYNQHGAARAHGFAGGSDATLMNDNAGAGKDGGKRVFTMGDFEGEIRRNSWGECATKATS